MANPMKVPFLDLVAPHQELEPELLDVVKKAFGNAGFIGGPMVEEFEREFAKFCDAKFCVGVNSGTDALRFAFMAAGVEPCSYSRASSIGPMRTRSIREGSLIPRWYFLSAVVI